MIVQIINEEYDLGYDVIVAGVGKVGANAVSNLPQTYSHITHSLKIFSESEPFFPFGNRDYKIYNDVCKQGDYIITIVDFDDNEAVERAFKYTKIPVPRYATDTASSYIYYKNEKCYSVCITLSKYNSKAYSEYLNYFDSTIFVDDINQLHLPIDIFLFKPINGLVGMDICDVFSIFKRTRNAYFLDTDTKSIDGAIADFSKDFLKIAKNNSIKKLNIFFEFSISNSTSLDNIEYISASICKIVDKIDDSAVIIWQAVLDENYNDDEIKLSSVISDIGERSDTFDENALAEMLDENFDEICSSLEKT